MAMASGASAFRQLGEALSQFEVGTTIPTQPLRPASSRHPRGWKGCLKDMHTLPLDLLFEILRHLEPLDILFLSRTTKDFRALLMSKTSVSFWMAARRNICGLPDCPSFLSEPAYANLVFNHSCNRCSRGRSRVILWEYRARYCSKCINRVTTKEAEIRLPDGLDCHKLLCVVKASPNHLKDDKRAHTPDLEKFLQAWGSTDPAFRSELLNSQEILRQTIAEFARACEVWAEESKKAVAAYRIEMHSFRLERVIEKLRVLGWGNELGFMAGSGYSPLSSLSFVGLPVPWDESAWERAKEKVVAAMEAAKINRLRSERVTTLRGRIESMMIAVLSFRREYGNGVFPRDRDFAALPEVQELIDVPDDVEVTPETFNCLRPMVPGLVESWYQQRLGQLEELLEKRMDTPHSAPLTGLAVYQFHKCPYCGALLDIPTMFVHHCRGYSYQGDSSTYNEAADEATRSWLTLRFEPKNDILKGILAACGQDYLRTTVEDMDKLDIRLSCRSCGDGLGDRDDSPWQAMSWRTAAQHGHWKWNHTFPCDWKVIPGDHLPVIKGLEATSAILSAQDLILQFNWSCGYCLRVHPGTRDQVCDHLRIDHDIQEPTDDWDLFLDRGIPRSPRPVYLISHRESAVGLPYYYQQVLQSGQAALVDLAYSD